MNGADIRFVHLGITIEHLKSSISVFGFRIAFYGIIIGIGMLAGIWIAQSDAKRRGQDPELYLDFALYAIICSIVGARIYYVIFEWDYYKENLLQIFNLQRRRACHLWRCDRGSHHDDRLYPCKKVPFLYGGYRRAGTGYGADHRARWGNFFNCEAFGGYTDSLLAMRIKRSLVNDNMLNADVLSHKIVENGVEFIQVHPTFLYESCWNLCLLIFMLWFRKYKKYDGQMFWIYLFGYGTGRFWIENLRTDQLILFGTGLAVSQALSLVLILVAAGNLIWRGRKHRQAA